VQKEDRERATKILDLIPATEWQAFLESPQGAPLKERLSLVRDGLRESGLVSVVFPRKPIAELLDVVGSRILSDREIGPWVREALVRHNSSQCWTRLVDAYKRLSPKRAERFHGNLAHHGQGPAVLATGWHQGGLWAHEFCRITGLPELFAEGRNRSLPEDELVVPAEPLPRLHSFQREVYQRLRAILRKGPGAGGLLSMPTGAGKTRVAVEAVCDHLADGSGDERRNLILWISQGEELQMQAWECFRQVWQVPPTPAAGKRPIARAVPCNLVRIWGGRDPSSIEIPDEPTVLIAGIDQLASWVRTRPEWYAKFPLRRLECVVIDEAHSVITKEYSEVLLELGLRRRRHWKRMADAPPLIGLSATPWRTDDEESRRLRVFFGKLVRPRSLGRNPVPYLQSKGFLSRVRYSSFMVRGTPPMTAKQKRHYNTFGDLPLDYIKELGQLDQRNGRILKQLAKQPKRRKGIVFACSIEHAETLAISLNRLLGAGSAAAVTSRTPRSERAILINRFKEDRHLRFLVNVGVLAFGFDAPRADSIFVTRPTTSALRYEQMVGRGLRGPKNGGTESCLVVDVQDEGMPDGVQSYERVAHLWQR
jgi:superfamily II DNA or RNA helicase